jgi:hypothetical protein
MDRLQCHFLRRRLVSGAFQWLTSKLPGAQQLPRSGNLLQRVRAERPVTRQGALDLSPDAIDPRKDWRG